MERNLNSKRKSASVDFDITNIGNGLLYLHSSISTIKSIFEAYPGTERFLRKGLFSTFSKIEKVYDECHGLDACDYVEKHLEEIAELSLKTIEACGDVDAFIKRFAKYAELNEAVLSVMCDAGAKVDEYEYYEWIVICKNEP